MVEVVKIGSSTISVRDDLAGRVVAVCLRCKGFGIIWKTNYLSTNPIEWIGRKIPCPTCNGKGLYRDSE